MPPPLSNLGPGDQIPRDQETWNALMAAGRKALGRSGGSYGATSLPGGPTVPQITAWVRNDTGDDLSALTVVKLSDPLVDAEELPHQVRAQPAFAGTTPDAASNAFGILLDAIPDGDFGRAIVLGWAVCDVIVNDSNHGYAVPKSGSTSALESASTGPAKIVHKYGTTGTVRAVVLLQGDGGVGSSGGSGGCGWVAGLTVDDCLRVSVISGEGRCGCVDTEQAERKLTSTDGETWGISLGSIGTGTGCLDGTTLPDAGTVSGLGGGGCAIASEPTPITLVEPGHWSTSGGWGGATPEGGTTGDLNLQCVDGAWTCFWDIVGGPVNGVLVSQFCLTDGNGTPTALIVFDFTVASPCEWVGRLNFQFFPDACAGTEGPTIKICESDVLLTFEKNCCGLPKLTLTGFEVDEACCGETFAASVGVTVVKDGTTYTGDWDESGNVWSGGLTSPPPPPPPTAECYQRTGLGTTFTRITPGVDQWNDGSGFRELRGPSMLGAGNWEYVDVGVCMSTWLASAWDGTGCKTFSSGGSCTPNTVEICVVSCP
jgi:hypothetical protein